MTTVLPPLSPQIALAGKPIIPVKRISLMDDKEFELLIEEWAKQRAYADVLHVGGAGDEGRDVCGFLTDQKFLGDWDAFQCKRNEKPLFPTIVWHDIGKLIWNVYSKNFTCPRTYMFIGSKGIGTKLSKYLSTATTLRDELIANWPGYVESTITTVPVPLTGDLLTFIHSFDFTIFGQVTLQTILEDLKGTPYYIETFGGGLPPRPAIPAAPATIQQFEAVYVEKLRCAYAEHAGKHIPDCTAIQGMKPYGRHFDQQRAAFFSAESLREFSNDSLPPGTFAALQTGILDAIQPILDDDTIINGYYRINQSLKQAAILGQPSNPLDSVSVTRDKHGICHQLANDSKLDWMP
jgi:hypothetical protein